MWWVKIVDLLLRRGLEHIERRQEPRRKLARSFVQLLRSVNKCHVLYLEYEKIGFEGTDEGQIAHRKWANSITDLARSIDSVRTLLEVHDDELLQFLQGYLYDDMRFVDSLTTKDSYPVRLLAHAIEDQLDETDFPSTELVTTRLKEFMRDRLKLSPEEIIDV
jgi:hypothetical protein